MNFTWSIDNVRRTTADGGVITVFWRCTADGVTDKRGVEAYKASSIELFPDVSSPDFVPFDQLTEEVVLGWVRDEIGADVEDEMADLFEDRANDATALGTPWG